MASTGKSTTATPVKEVDRSSRSKTRGPKMTENVNPNLSHPSPGLGQRPSGSPLVKSASKGQKSASRNPNPVVYSPRNKIRERKFVVAKKKAKKGNGASGVTCKCKDRDGGGNAKKCFCVAYENLRVSQEEFFKNGSRIEEAGGGAENEIEDELEKKFMTQIQIEDGNEEEGVKNSDSLGNGETEQSPEIDSSSNKRRRDKVLEETRKSVPEPGSGRVKFLIKAFEDNRTVSTTTGKSWGQEDEEETEPEEDKAPKWLFPELQPPPPKVSETPVSTSSFCTSDLFLTSENLGLHRQYSVSNSWDSSRGSISSKSSNGDGHGSRRNSTESSATGGTRRWKKKQQARVTSLKPFRLRTEQRGKMKEEEFMKKLQEMTIEEKKQRIPVAQGLPWTTDEPECLIKPQVKEITEPVDPILHSDVRAMERAEFDNQVAEKLNLIEQYKMERERQQKLAEEEEIKRLRKELVPKAQPMPYFDRPFIPKRSEKNPTMPKEPRFHIPQHKKIKSSLSMSSYTCTE